MSGVTRETEYERGDGEDLAARVRALESLYAETRRSLDGALARLTELEAARHASPADGLREIVSERFAAIYPAFEDHFRGSETEITARQSVYLPVVEQVIQSGGVVDVGPGRGEWLTLLRDRGIPAYGVEAHPRFVDVCHSKGLMVIHGDAIRHLWELPPATLDMVTSFHVVEHLDTEDLLGLIAAAHRALRPGGCLLLETPNPTNLVMGACDFYADPTHRSPLPPHLLEYLVAVHGFGAIEVRHLHPRTEQLRQVHDLPMDGELKPFIEAVAQRLYGPQDYAILGYRLSLDER
ncbi:MAG: class I SAM-dependent methyltransferase [Ktedonobacterales bacterium]